MNTRTGEIIEGDAERIAQALQKNRDLIEVTKDEVKIMKPMVPQQRKNWMRNQPCRCGSGKKFKRCCW